MQKVVVLLLIFYFLSACRSERRIYRQALKDAHKAEANEIREDLLTLTPEDPRVDCIVKNGKPYPSLVSWVIDSSMVYRDSSGRWRAAEDIWVTAEPELRMHCTAPTGIPLQKKLSYLLGLPPSYPGRFILRFRVPVDSVFRPCPDPETDDKRCELQYPEETPARHRQWMENTFRNSFSAKNLYERFPWTRLGYTYNRDPAAPDEKGLSEFVVRKGSPLDSLYFMSPSDYCRQHP